MSLAMKFKVNRQAQIQTSRNLSWQEWLSLHGSVQYERVSRGAVVGFLRLLRALQRNHNGERWTALPARFGVGSLLGALVTALPLSLALARCGLPQRVGVPTALMLDGINAAVGAAVLNRLHDQAHLESHDEQPVPGASVSVPGLTYAEAIGLGCMLMLALVRLTELKYGPLWTRI